MKLSDWAKVQGITYQAAWNQYKKGQIPSAYRLGSGSIIIPDDKNSDKSEYTVCYARVFSEEYKNDLDSQVERLREYCSVKGYKINEIIKEYASGLDDYRPKLEKLLRNAEVTRIVVENNDRLTRFGFNYIKILKEFQGCRIEIINENGNDKDDLIHDFAYLAMNFTERIKKNDI